MSLQPSPLNAGPYSRFMVELYDENNIIGVPTGFLNFFGRGGILGSTRFSPDANSVTIDIKRGNLKIAALINRGQASRSVTGLNESSGDKFSEFIRSFPLSEEVDSINAEDLNYRVGGEAVFESSLTKRDRLRILASQHHNVNISRMVRLWEVLCSQSILTGVMDGILGTSNTALQYDFRRNGDYDATPSPKWDGTDPTILADIDGRCDFVRETGHHNPDMGIMGSDIIEPFLTDTNVLALADNRRFELININSNPVPPRFAPFIAGGMIPRGRLRTPKGYEIWLFSYIDTYQNAAGTHVKFMPADEMLICSSLARCDRYFGPSDVLPLTSAKTAWFQELLGFSLNSPPMPQNIKGAQGLVPPAAFYHDAYEDGEGKTVTVRTQCAPIFAPVATDAFAKLVDILT